MYIPRSLQIMASETRAARLIQYSARLGLNLIEFRNGRGQFSGNL